MRHQEAGSSVVSSNLAPQVGFGPDSARLGPDSVRQDTRQPESSHTGTRSTQPTLHNVHYRHFRLDVLVDGAGAAVPSHGRCRISLIMPETCRLYRRGTVCTNCRPASTCTAARTESSRQGPLDASGPGSSRASAPPRCLQRAAAEARTVPRRRHLHRTRRDRLDRHPPRTGVCKASRFRPHSLQVAHPGRCAPWTGLNMIPA